jgi:predicted branched-subunit amino acid permease
VTRSTRACARSKSIFWQGVREAAGIPAAVLVAGYLGFGALAAAHDIPLAVAVASTAMLWALPGQIVFVEMHALAAPLLASVLAVMLSSARFLPMTLMLMPEMRDPQHRRWKYYVVAQLLSLSGWTMAVARFPDIPRSERLAWFYGFALVLMAASAASTAAGHLGADRLPALARLALVFTVPMYYLLILTGAVRDRIAALGLACGAVAGPLAYLATPEWSVPLGGVAGGTFAFFALKLRAKHG